MDMFPIWASQRWWCEICFSSIELWATTYLTHLARLINSIDHLSAEWNLFWADLWVLLATLRQFRSTKLASSTSCADSIVRRIVRCCVKQDRWLRCVYFGKCVSECVREWERFDTGTTFVRLAWHHLTSSEGESVMIFWHTTTIT